MLGADALPVDDPVSVEVLVREQCEPGGIPLDGHGGLRLLGRNPSLSEQRLQRFVPDDQGMPGGATRRPGARKIIKKRSKLHVCNCMS